MSAYDQYGYQNERDIAQLGKPPLSVRGLNAFRALHKENQGRSQ
jgi:hypothetical protein